MTLPKQFPGVTSTTFRDETRMLLLQKPRDLSNSDIAKALGISATWLGQFARGDIPNPGVVTIETLNGFLKKYNRLIP